MKRIIIAVTLVITVIAVMICLGGCKPKVVGTWYYLSDNEINLNNDGSFTWTGPQGGETGKYEIVDDGKTVKLNPDGGEAYTSRKYRLDIKEINGETILVSELETTSYYFNSKDKMKEYYKEKTKDIYKRVKKNLASHTWAYYTSYTDGSKAKTGELRFTNDGKFSFTYKDSNTYDDPNVKISGTYKLSKFYDTADVGITFNVKDVAGTDAYGDSALSYAKFGPEEVIKGKNEIDYINVYSTKGKWYLDFYTDNIIDFNYDGTDYNYSAE
jgi:hypothetical protein